MVSTRATLDPATMIAYFSMEIAVAPDVPTYSGGLGVLAGDHLRAAADLGLPIVGVTLLYRSGFFRQILDDLGHQTEVPEVWSPDDLLEPLDARTIVTVGGRQVTVGAWCYRVVGVGGHEVPVIFLDTGLEVNDDRDRDLTERLYFGDGAHRLRQETVLGLAGVALLDELGLSSIRTFHMNEGHCALVTLALAGVTTAATSPGAAASKDFAAARTTVQPRCVFTTHTPVPEGHDRFHGSLVRDLLGDVAADFLSDPEVLDGDELNMTRLGMTMSRFVNGVSLRHGELSREMFPSTTIGAITNGVHAGTWVSPSMAAVFDRQLPAWRRDNTSLRYASAIALVDIAEAHAEAKRSMLGFVADRTGRALDPSVLTLGVARRAAAYKRTDLLLSDPDRLRRIVDEVGPVQVVYSGKAHPADDAGKAMILRIHEAARELDGAVAVVYVPDYSFAVGQSLCAGVDVWVNTPARPFEASGTSGMKAAMNGVPSFSILDGWWIEGHLEGITGWCVGGTGSERDDDADAADLYAKLESIIAPLYYRSPDGFNALRRSAITLNGSYFTTERMVRQYAVLAYDFEPDLS